MTNERRDLLLMAVAQVFLAVVYRAEWLSVADRQRFARYLGEAIDEAGGVADPF